MPRRYDESLQQFTWDPSGGDNLAGPSLVNLLSQLTADWGYNPGNAERAASEAAVRGASPGAIMGVMQQGQQTRNLREQLANELQKAEMARQAKMAELMASQALSSRKLDQDRWAKEGDWNKALAVENVKAQRTSADKAMDRSLEEAKMRQTGKYQEGMLGYHLADLERRDKPTYKPPQPADLGTLITIIKKEWKDRPEGKDEMAILREAYRRHAELSGAGRDTLRGANPTQGRSPTTMPPAKNPESQFVSSADVPMLNGSGDPSMVRQLTGRDIMRWLGSDSDLPVEWGTVNTNPGW